MAHESNLAALVEEVKAARLAFEAGDTRWSRRLDSFEASLAGRDDRRRGGRVLLPRSGSFPWVL